MIVELINVYLTISNYSSSGVYIILTANYNKGLSFFQHILTIPFVPSPNFLPSVNSSSKFVDLTPIYLKSSSSISSSLNDID